MKTQLQRFEEKIQKTKTCWLWKGTIGSTGYGGGYWDKKNQYAHRISYLIYKGEISSGLVIDHLCRVRNCVNPEHLEAVTPEENMRRGELLKRIPNGLCLRGHKLTKENTYYVGRYVQCRKCNTIRQKKFMDKQKLS